RRRGNLPKQVTEFLKGWLVDHKQHPYPSEKEKHQLAHETGLTVNQISNWFIN
ncbi:homeobox KN domain-containing protein, partial [Dichotomocladium elegans]